MHSSEHVVYIGSNTPLHACRSARGSCPIYAHLYIISAMPKLQNQKLTREVYGRPLTIQAILWRALRELEYISCDWWSGDDNTQDLFDEFCGYENSFWVFNCKIPGCIVCGTRPPRQGIRREEAEDFEVSLLPPPDSGWLFKL